jgi:hypothetical protein
MNLADRPNTRLEQLHLEPEEFDRLYTLAEARILANGGR